MRRHVPVLRAMGSNPIPSATRYGAYDAMKLDDGIALVKEQMEYHRKQSLKYANERKRATAHDQTAWRFGALLDDLLAEKAWREENPNWNVEKGLQGYKPLALSWDEVEGLPAEVLSELSISESDRAEFNILAAIRSVGGIASLDRILIALYNANGEIQKRMSLNQKLYRMGQKGMVFAVPGKKGVYSVDQLSNEEAAALD